MQGGIRIFEYTPGFIHSKTLVADHEYGVVGTAIEAAVTELKAINRRSHKEAFSQLNAIWDDIKRIDSRLDIQDKKAIR